MLLSHYVAKLKEAERKVKEKAEKAKENKVDKKPSVRKKRVKKND
ncbi:hypothetical protein ACM26V_16855 [Salipaludibacillus sp. HK11]